MAVSSNQAFLERRTRSLTMVRKLVEGRTEMLSLYGQLASKKPFQEYQEVPSLLQDFCAALIDYTANAHFQLYRFFAEKRERRQEVLEVADSIYPRIVDATQTVLDFNDKYDSEQQTFQLASLEEDLSRLGEHLADRIELEDRLIDILSVQRN